MRVTDTTKHARFVALAAKALGYPREADTRGRRCPPAPFGRTDRYVEPTDPDEDGFPTIEIETAVSAQIAVSSRLTGPERAEYATLIVGATPSAQIAKETARER